MPSQFEARIGQRILQQFPFFKIERNIRPEWLRHTTHCLELDFYLPELNLAFEIQGIQHYQFVPFFHKSFAEFEAQQTRDEVKRALCKERQVHLIEIADDNDYDRLQWQIDEALKAVEKTVLHQYILKRGAQTIINIIALMIKLQKGTAPPRTIARWKRNLEAAREMLRYISIRSIQDFYGILPFQRPSKYKAQQQLRAQGRTVSRPRFDRRKRKGEWGRMRRWV